MSEEPHYPASPTLHVEIYLNALKEGRRRAGLSNTAPKLNECTRKWNRRNNNNFNMGAQATDFPTEFMTVKSGGVAHAKEFVSFQNARHCFLDNYACAIGTVNRTPDTEKRLQSLAIVATYEADCRSDAMLYAQGKRSDEQTFEQLYGLPVKTVLEMVNSYGGGIGLTNMYATVKRKPNFSRSGLCQLEFAFRRFSYRFDFWVKRDLCGRSIFKEELDDAVMRFWKIYESYHTV